MGGHNQVWKCRGLLDRNISEGEFTDISIRSQDKIINYL